jgi:hypothetical protein
MKRSLLIVAILTLLFVTACQPVADARSQACNSMREAATQADQIKSAVLESKPVMTVAQLRESVRLVRAKIATAQAVYSAIRGSDNIVQLTLALNQIEADLQGVPDATPVSDLRAKLADSATAVSNSATAWYDAVCSAK